MTISTDPQATQPQETSWTPYLVGGGVLAFMFGSAYLAYKATPFALAATAPELLPHYEGLRRAQGFNAKQAHVLRMVEELTDQPAGSLDPIPVIEEWYVVEPDKTLAYPGFTEIHGRVYGKPGVKEGGHIEVMPETVNGKSSSDATEGDLVQTLRSRYRLGKKASA